VRYIDSSVLLRIVFDAPNALRKSDVASGITSSLTQVECLRTIDRLRLIDRIATAEIERRRELTFAFLASFKILGLTPFVLSRAAEPFSLPLKTLDAIHLATAMLWREDEHIELDFATHDTALANAARAYGFPVLGV